jgi:hypothetical protein
LARYSEFDVFDHATRSLDARPVGWDLARYLPDGGPRDGWDDLQGYFQGRRRVDA